MTVTILRRFIFLAAAAMLGSAMTHAATFEEKTLLTTDGTLFVVRAGTAADLGIVGNYVTPDANVVEWASLRQDGTRGLGLIPGTVDSALKHNVNLVYDEVSGSLIVLFVREAPLLNVLQLAILRGDQWTVSNLLPNLGFPRALNPQMLLSHPAVHTLDANGNDVWTTHSLLNVVWWEVSNISQARYAPIFLDEDSTAADVQAYDLPATVGGGGPTPAPNDIPAGAYLYPSLQPEGPGGGILASFADLHAGRQYVVRISFPTDLGTPGPGNPTWLRRRIPVVGIAMDLMISKMAPSDGSVVVSTFIGSGYRPTLLWRDADAVHFLRFDGKKWSDVNSIALGDDMSYDRALRLVQDMATKN